MNELVYLTEDDFDALNSATFSLLYASNWGVGDECDNLESAMSKLREAKDKGLFISFDVKKAKVRRARR